MGLNQVADKPCQYPVPCQLDAATGVTCQVRSLTFERGPANGIGLPPVGMNPIPLGGPLVAWFEPRLDGVKRPRALTIQIWVSLWRPGFAIGKHGFHHGEIGIQAFYL